MTVQKGITAVAISAGGSDTCGVITTTGTNDGTGDSTITVTFNKTYTTAPKAVVLQPLNAAAALCVAATGQGAWVTVSSATAFVIHVPSSATAAATPSWAYMVIA